VFLLGGPSYRIALIDCQNAKAEREGCFFFSFQASPSRSEFWECSKDNSYFGRFIYLHGKVELLQLLFVVVLFGFVNGELQMK